MNETGERRDTVTIVHPTPAEFEPARELLALAEGYVVTTPALYRSAAEDLKRVKTMAKNLEDREKTITKPLNEAVKAVRDLFREPRAWLDRAEARIKATMITYDQQEEARRREEQAKKDAAARAERERLEREAAKLAAKGKHEQAEAKASIAQVISAPVVESDRPKVEGVAYRDKYDAAVVDKKVFLEYVAATPALHYLVDVNGTNLRKLAEAQRDSFHLPGAELRKGRVLASTR